MAAVNLNLRNHLKIDSSCLNGNFQSECHTFTQLLSFFFWFIFIYLFIFCPLGDVVTSLLLFPVLGCFSRFRELCAALIFFISTNWAFFTRTENTEKRHKRQKTDKFQLKAWAVAQWACHSRIIDANCGNQANNQSNKANLIAHFTTDGD